MSSLLHQVSGLVVENILSGAFLVDLHPHFSEFIQRNDQCVQKRHLLHFLFQLFGQAIHEYGVLRSDALDSRAWELSDDDMDYYYWGIVNLICETPNTLKNEEVEALI